MIALQPILKITCFVPMKMAATEYSAGKMLTARLPNKLTQNAEQRIPSPVTGASMRVLVCAIIQADAADPKLCVSKCEAARCAQL